MPQNEPIAIVGSACRFPGESSSPSKLWSLLSNPRDVLSKIGSSRFNPEGFYNKDGEYHGSSNVTESYLLSEDHRVFDAPFFKIKPVEAHSIDPQQRLLMETVYETVESAGFTIEGMQGSDTAVYVGLMCEEYGGIISGDVDQLPTYTATATGRSIMSNRISYFFDWHGPCMTIDTACSSSLVAVHQAVETLRNGLSRVAVAAGSNLILSPWGYITESKLHMLSPDSRSRMWDADANGYARGEGVAAVILKRLSDAINDGDHVECVIRETGVNQDGRTTGLTMPSSTAQEALIRATYAKAGLDLAKSSDRCQFFEAHGTGTPAGDPIEARAIHEAFFGQDVAAVEPDDVLYVGSIKTVVGHTEGTAGIAALMKASLAIQHKCIPPNLLFNKLSPAVEPFYRHLEIPVAARPWPALPDGVPRRASVNSFGFGGTNAHAIIEEYKPAITPKQLLRIEKSFLPFCISAASETSLLEQARRLSSFLEENPSVNMHDLAWTLSVKRSTFPFRWSFSASTREQLVAKIEKSLTAGYETSNIVQAAKPKVLGVFTGQGAQWATMARSLITASPFVEHIVDRLEASLAQLPNRPDWSLKSELLAEPEASRISQASISQPLCTAVQIILVDMLAAAGVKFDAVVGHSSGEIAAAYASGLLSAEDAIRIAYLRGVYSMLACGYDGKKGGMLAAGTSLEDARQLCDFDQLRGRISLAASNSPASVTLSGDIDAIGEAKCVLEDEGKFARMLRVDTAYHSHHMIPCAEPYVQSMHACSIKPIANGQAGTTWFSSVREDCCAMSSDTNGLDGEYWKDNMVNPVLFSQALKAAISAEGPFDIALEVGPHPALQGPVTQTVQEATGSRILYCGLLSRGVNDMQSYADALGYLWRHLPAQSSAVDFKSFNEAMTSVKSFALIKGLPSYSFDHSRVYWQESRYVKATRTRKSPYHELLGVACPDGSQPIVTRWKNLLTPKEIPWLNGHMVQGQIVFPAAGYLSMTVDACRALVADMGVSLYVQTIDVLDFVITKAIIFDERSLGVETMLSLVLDEGLDQKAGSFSAAVRIYAGLTGADSASLPLRCSCRVYATFKNKSSAEADEENETLQALLPARSEPLVNTVTVDSSKFYSCLAEVGYQYSGYFKGLSELTRTLDAASGIIANPGMADPIRSPSIHPALIDCSIQIVLLAFSYPGDGKLFALHVPTKINRISFDLPLLQRETVNETLLPVDAAVDPSGRVSGDSQLLARDGQSTLIQIQGLEVEPLAPPVAKNDSQLFYTYELAPLYPNQDLITKGRRATVDDHELAEVSERISYYYLKKFLADITDEDIERSQWYHKRQVNFARKALDDLKTGRDPWANPAWYNDSDDQVAAMLHKYRNKIEMRLVTAVGENIAPALRGETTVLEHMTKGNMLHDFYSECLGFNENSHFLATAISQLTYRFPHMNILEIGAGTGGATKIILPELGQSFASYTFTDISGGFFPKAREVFGPFEERMIFSVLDAEKDVVEQGFAEHSYDLVVASMVLHATRDLDATMRNVRRLLKPGGYVALLEVTNTRPIRTSFAMSGLPGWWLGDASDGREFSPCVPTSRWDNIMQRVGFGPVDAISPDLDAEPWPFSIIVSQAVDERVLALRSPLSAPVVEPSTDELIIVRGGQRQSEKIAQEVQSLLSSQFVSIRLINRLEELADADISTMTTLLVLADLDSPTFQEITQERWETLRRLMDHAKQALWVTSGARAGIDPYLNMAVGWGRTAAEELPHLRLQFFDFNPGATICPKLITEALLRLQIVKKWNPVDESDALLWTIEPEVVIERGGLLLVPRLLPSKERNDRYNSTRRKVTKYLNPQESPISIERSYAGTYKLVDQLQPGQESVEQSSQSFVSIEVSQSLLRPIKTSESNSFYISAGKVAGTGSQVFTLSKTLSTALNVPVQWTFECAHSSGEVSTAARLASFVGAVIASRIVGLAEATTGTTLVIHNAPEILTDSLISQARQKNIAVLFTRSAITYAKAGARQESDSSVLNIHPRASNLTLMSILPKNASVFVDFSSPATMSSVQDTLGDKISACLGRTCLHLSAATFFGVEANDIECRTVCPSELAVIHQAISKMTYASNFNMLELADIPVLDTTSLALDSTVSWKPADAKLKVPVEVGNVDTGFRFKPDRSYLLVGLSGQMGKSICTWMVRHGARHIIMTSRRPLIDEAWVQEMHKIGAVNIKFIPCDVTSRESVAALLAKARQTMPKIAGFANGAMVLQDTPIREMTAEILQKVFRPKVDGSRYLDELLRPEEPLDFAIYFSSVASVLGNLGQSNYTAANLFMNAMAARRRQEGLASSVIAVGSVVGIGYMARELTERDMQRIKDRGYTPLSERDVHQLFCEGILAGQPRPDDGNWNSQSTEVVCGVRIAEPDEERPIRWFVNPMIGHCIRTRTQNEKKAGSSNSSIPVRTRLLEVATKEEAFATIRDCFLERLQGMLQSDSAPSLDLAADELGVDSLVAVDIRSWFLRELQVDIPVLKILGGATIGDMIELSLEEISPALIPKVPADATLDRANVAEESKGGIPVAQVQDTPNENSNVSSAPTVGSSPVIVASDIGSSSGGMASPSSSPKLAGISMAGSMSNSTAATSIYENSDGKSSSDLCDTLGGVRRTPMSFGQSRFWFLQQYLHDKATFNITAMFTLDGDINIHSLVRAVEEVGKNHEALRTRFRFGDDGSLVQEIMATSKLQLHCRQVNGPNEGLQEFERLKQYEYDLHNGDTMHINLLTDTSSPNTYYLYIGYHHINMDAISLGVLFADLHKAYAGARVRPTLQYPAFAVAQRAALDGGQMKAETTYWMKEFDPLPADLPLLPFSSTVSRLPLAHYAAHTVDVRISSSVASQIKHVVRHHRVSPYHIYLATFRAMLSRIYASVPGSRTAEDIVIGMADSNRTESGSEGAIGMFVNLLPLRFKSNVFSQTFSAAIKEVQSKVRQALANSRLPFDALLEELKPPRSAGAAPLFQAFIDYRQPLSADRSRAFGCRVVREEFVRGNTGYDVVLDIVDTADGEALVQFTVPTLLYSAEDVGVLSRTYLGMLDAFTKSPTVGLTDPPLYSREDDIQRTIALGRGSDADTMWESIPLRILNVMNTHSDKVALRDGLGHVMTFQEVDCKVWGAAAAMYEAGVRAGSIVAVLQEPSADWAVAVLAILRLNAIYAPLDIQLPVSRLEMILQDSQPVAIAAHKATRTLLEALKQKMGSAFKSQLLYSEAFEPQNALSCSRIISSGADANRPAFILYTSGSTGVPKGVILKQSNLHHQVESAVHYYGIQPHWTVLQQTALTFDLSMFQLLLAFTSGAALYVVPRHRRGDPMSITRILQDQGINFTCATPSEYSLWLHHGDEAAIVDSPWHVAVSAGETFTPGLQAAFRALAKPGLAVYNGYGPCETTFLSHSIELDYMSDAAAEAPIPVGRAFSNFSTYIVDEQLNILPVGKVGQIAIGGVGVAKGYLNRDELTSQVFVPDPFATSRNKARQWSTMYLSGDGGFLREDGSLMSLVRLAGKTQVKLRGMRFDLLDVEMNIIGASDGVVAEAVASIRGNDSDSLYLVAHIVFAKGRLPEAPDEYCSWLVNILPISTHMKPTIIIPIEEMPLTLSLKVDRDAVQNLPLVREMIPDSGKSDNKPESDAESCLSHAEGQIYGLWQKLLPEKVLNLKPITSDTDFFAVGGNSLLLVRLQSAIKEAFEHSIPLLQLFETSTLSGMAACIAKSTVGAAVGGINWGEETAPPVIDRPAEKMKTVSSPPRNIVLTGATGFLGRSILEYLLRHDVERVDCIAVRDAGSRSLPPIMQDPRVHVHHGDLNEPQLGLTASAVGAIFGSADAIIHNAADVSFLKSYASLRDSNLNATRTIVNLALPSRVPVHFISTAGVAHLVSPDGEASESLGVGEVSVAAATPPTDGSDGYVASKWAAERFLERTYEATLAQGAVLPVWIHRPSSVMGEGASETDLMSSILKYSILQQAIPMLATGSEDNGSPSQAPSFLDFVDVETVSQSVTRHVMAPEGKNWWAQGVQYSHHSGEYVIPMQALVSSSTATNENQNEAPPLTEGFQVKQLAEWVDGAKSLGMNELVVALLQSAVDSAGGTLLQGHVMFPRLLKGRRVQNGL